MNCPKCNHEFPYPGGQKGGKSRWSGLSKKARSVQMSLIRRAGLEKISFAKIDGQKPTKKGKL